MHIESTRSCGQIPRLLVLLEELNAPYELTLRSSGHFLATYGRPGPLLVDDDLTLFESAAMLRHCARTCAEGRMVPRPPRDLARVDAWLELSNQIGMTVVSLLREEHEQGAERRPARIAEERAKLAGMLAAIERALFESDGDWLLGDFGLADCAMVNLPRLAQLLDFAQFPGVRAYCERLLQRPAVGRMQEKLAPSSAAAVSPEQVLEFWFGAPANTELDLMQKARRWFAGGAAMDAEVKRRFGDTVDAALEGRLDAWASTLPGRLALIVVLDQFARHALRGDPRAFSGDKLAQRLAIEAFRDGADEALSVPERLFLTMPLIHAEDPKLLALAREVARRIAATAPPLFAKGCAMQVEQADKYFGVVTRFGRFPHRNAVLGRVSTAEEQAFLLDWAEKAPPAGAPRPDPTS